MFSLIKAYPYSRRKEGITSKVMQNMHLMDCHQWQKGKDTHMRLCEDLGFALSHFLFDTTINR